VPHAIRPGDVLADRYHLVDLLDESGGGLFYRAHDASLDRSVAVHIIRADDDRAALLREAARTSARVVDRRLLRVLDVDEATGRTARDGSPLCFVVNEWATGVSLDILLAAEGPLAPRRAAWIISEVAGTLEVAHAAGVAHGRLVPENVLVDRTGSVRVIGFAVDAALHGLPPGRAPADVTALAGLLYAALTARWPGQPGSAVKPAPLAHGRVLRPRQVRAGVPRVLDTLCDAVLNPDAGAPGSHARGAFDLTTAGGICDALREFVGDPVGLADAEAAAIRRREAGQANSQVNTQMTSQTTQRMPVSSFAAPSTVEPEPPTELPEVTSGRPETPEPDTSVVIPLTRDAGAEEEPEPEAEPPADPVEPEESVESEQRRTAEPHIAPTDQPSDEPTGEPTGKPTGKPTGTATGRSTDQPAGQPIDRPTEAGIPIFDDDGDVSWLAKRAEKPPPPPPFDAIPERPLFAPDPADGSPARQPRPTVDQGGHPNGPASDGYWPWDTNTGTGAPLTMTGSGIIEPVDDEEDENDEQPGRSWLWLAALVATMALVLLAVVVAFNVGRGRTPLGAEPETEGSRTPSPTSSQSADAGPTPFAGLTATDFDPQGEDLQENPDLAALAVDGDPGTGWRTVTYEQQLGPAGLKTGVGLTLDLGAAGEVDEVDVALLGAPTAVSVYVTEAAPRGVRGLTPVATGTAEGTDLGMALEEAATGRFVTVWLTSLPAVDGGFRGEVAEVTVLGTPQS